MDWATKTQVASLLGEAEKLSKERKLLAARDKYDAVLKLDSKVVEAQQARDEVGREIAAFEEKQAYVANVEPIGFRQTPGLAAAGHEHLG